MTDVVRQVLPPAGVRSGSGLERVDYCDAFLAPLSPDGAADAEAWLRRAFGGPGGAAGVVLVAGWLGLGLALHPRRSGTVLGWAVRERTPDRLVLAVGSRIGMPAELLVERHDDDWLLATRVHLGNRAVRVLWRAVTPLHVLVIRTLLTWSARTST